MNKQKMCANCKETKDITEFAKNRTTKDGLQAWCKECNNTYSKQYRKDNNEYVKQYREENKGYYLYFIYSYKECVYVGSTSNLLNRISSHTNGHTHLKDKISRWTSIKYIDLTNIVESREELYFTEMACIELLSPAWNSTEPSININHNRALELYDLIEEYINADNLELYKTNYSAYKDLYNITEDLHNTLYI